MHRMVVPSMYRAIPKETICTSIQDETGTIVATGLGIRDRDYVGVYAIHVHPAYRHRHYASSICRTILSEGIRLGATKAYLQVVEGNTPAITLYESLGFPISIPTGSARRTWSDFRLILHKKHSKTACQNFLTCRFALCLCYKCSKIIQQKDCLNIFNAVHGFALVFSVCGHGNFLAIVQTKCHHTHNALRIYFFLPLST